MVEIFGVLAGFIWGLINIKIEAAEGINISIFMIMITVFVMAYAINYMFGKVGRERGRNESRRSNEKYQSKKK